MYTNVSLTAPWSAIAFLATGFFISIVALVLVHAVVTRRIARAGATSLVVALLMTTYFGVMLIFSLKEGEWLTHLLIGNENSPLHEKTKFCSSVKRNLERGKT
jgi:uncharacterized membrane protein YraQ (UPF0718 family)